MKTRRVKMSITEFHALRRHFAWKCEYLNGEALLRPRELVLVGHLPLDSVPEPGSPPEGLRIRSLSTASPTTLARLYREAFRDTPELCEYQGATMTKEIERWLKQEVACAHPTSLILCPRSHPHAVVALALIKRTHRSFLLDTLAVRTRYQRRGAATYLLRQIAHQLRNEGVNELLSTYHPLNEASLAWHQRQGFTTLPSLQIARLQLSAARANGDDTTALADEVRRLESWAQQAGIEAVEPIMEVW